MIQRTKLTIATAILGSVLCSQSAFADLYAGAAVTYAGAEYQHTPSSGTADASPLLVQAQLGYFFTDYFAVEGRYGTSIQRSGGLNVDHTASALLKGNVPVTDQLSMYGLLGYSSVTIDQQNVGSGSDSGMSFGLGMHYALSSYTAVTFEFLNNLNSDKARLNGLSLGFQYRF
ncbi:porin family protein [Vibrio mediterranei]|uniref:outer membrane beta-barrel protein n=1 Tax=Vibrio mediterranei TaxID=689 RepID=UPI000D185CBD|nr:outer membrane beta-barrel protein [Vibrio mediterranei]PTC02987.1 porin family protein [Vibrio mediterranei]